METPLRSLVKAMFWQALGLVSMAAVGLLVTGSLALGGTLAALNAAIGFALYLAYERVWTGIRWGRHD